MADLRIIHMTDTHILLNYENAAFFHHIQQRITPDNYFSLGLDKAQKIEADLLVITGDLVHEGTEADYRYLKEKIQAYLPNLPVLYVLGNHDRKAEFYRGVLGEEKAGPYYRVDQVKGYRLITLDTSIEDQSNGELDDQQLAWLQEELQTPAPKGTILLGHHPILSQQNWFSVNFTDRLLEVLADSDVFLYLCGHAHYGETRQIGPLLQITGESFAFGVESQGEQVIYTESRGFSSCRIEGHQVTCHPYQLFPYTDTIHVFQSAEDSLKG